MAATSAELLPVRSALRACALVLAGAAAASLAAALALGHLGLAWAAWAAGAYVSWAVALTILARRGLARGAAKAEPVAQPVPGLTRPRGRVAAAALVLLAAVVAGAAAAGAGHVTAGALAAAATAALAAARWSARLESRRGGVLCADLGARRLVLARRLSERPAPPTS